MSTKFKFYLDEKVKMWTRSSFTVEAETEEKAKELVKNMFNEGITSADLADSPLVEFEETEYLYETENPISVEENAGCATQELFCGSAIQPTMFIDNTPNQ